MAAVSISGSALAQSAQVGLHSQSYAVTDADAVGLRGVELITMPWSVEAPVASWSTLSVGGALARASISSADGTNSSVRGLTDTRLTLRGSWNGFAPILTASLPTGVDTRTIEEATVVGVLASDLLPVPVTRFGSGLGLGADLTYGLRFRRTTVAVGVGYSSTGELAELEGAPGAYSPGSQVRARAAMERSIGGASVLTLLVALRRHMTDTFDGLALVTPGDRLEGTVSLAFPLGARESAMFYSGFLHRGEAEIGRGPEGVAAPLEVLIPGAGLPLPRTLIVGGTEGRLSRDRWSLSPRAELRVLRSASGLNQGWMGSFEGGGEYRVFGERLGRGLLLQPRIAARVGKLVVHEAAASTILGWEAGLGLAWQLGH